jgi:thiol:disulfide interchange protein DsbD
MRQYPGKCVLVFSFLLTGTCLFCQTFPVGFEYTAEKKSGVLYDLHIKAKMENGWHIYAQKQPKGASVTPTTVAFAKSPMVVLVDDLKEIGKKEVLREKNFTAFLYSNAVDFVQTIQLRGKVRTNISGSITVLVCDDTHCLPPRKIPFTIPIL